MPRAITWSMSSPGRRFGQRGVNGRCAGARAPQPAQTSPVSTAGGGTASRRCPAPVLTTTARGHSGAEVMPAVP